MGVERRTRTAGKRPTLTVSVLLVLMNDALMSEIAHACDVLLYKAICWELKIVHLLVVFKVGWYLDLLASFVKVNMVLCQGLRFSLCRNSKADKMRVRLCMACCTWALVLDSSGELGH